MQGAFLKLEAKDTCPNGCLLQIPLTMIIVEQQQFYMSKSIY